MERYIDNQTANFKSSVPFKIKKKGKFVSYINYIMFDYSLESYLIFNLKSSDIYLKNSN